MFFLHTLSRPSSFEEGFEHSVAYDHVDEVAEPFRKCRLLHPNAHCCCAVLFYLAFASWIFDGMSERSSVPRYGSSVKRIHLP